MFASFFLPYNVNVIIKQQFLQSKQQFYQYLFYFIFCIIKLMKVEVNNLWK